MPGDSRDELAAKALRTSIIAMFVAVLALLVGIGLWLGFIDDPDPKPEPGPSIKVVRIKNSSGKKILSGVRVVAQTSATRLGTTTSPTLIWSFPDDIPDGNDPGSVGDLLTPQRLPSPPWPLGTPDWGYKKLVTGVPPPYDRAWRFDISIEGQEDDPDTPEDETEPPTVIDGAMCTVPDPTNGAYIKEVLAEVQVNAAGDQFRVHFTVNYWREEYPGVHFDEGEVTSTTGWLAKGTTGTP